jgi:GNAT superfamily N-acetyltransferase
LAKSHDRAAFQCGSTALDVYVHRYALQNRKANVAAPYVLTADDNRTIIGFYTLSACHVLLISLPPEIQAELPRYPEVPATLLGRLAVNTSYRGQGYGRLLLLDALHRAVRGSMEIASALIVVDAKDEGAAEFYRTFEFQELGDEPGRFFVPVADVAELFTDEG